MFEVNVGVIKVVPSYVHDTITRPSIDRLCIRTNVSESDLEWTMATTFRPTIGVSGRHADDCLLSPLRIRNNVTLVQLRYPVEEGLKGKIYGITFNNSPGSYRH